MSTSKLQQANGDETGLAIYAANIVVILYFRLRVQYSGKAAKSLKYVLPFIKMS